MALRKLLISLSLLPYGQFAQLRGHWAYWVFRGKTVGAEVDDGAERLPHAGRRAQSLQVDLRLS